MALVGHYKLNGNANDSSGSGYHGTVSGATLATDKNGIANNCYSFDGLDDYINLNRDLLTYPENFTLSIWIKNDTSGAEAGRIWQAGLASGGTDYGFAIIKTSGISELCYFVIKPTSGTEYYCATISIPNGEWVNVIVTKNANIINTYRNGIFLATKDIITSEYRRDIWTSIGGSQVNLNFKGLIDDVRIYDYPLSKKEIKELSLGKFAHYKFDGNANDCSGNNLNGTAGADVDYETTTPLIGSSSASFAGNATTANIVQLPFGNGFNPYTQSMSYSLWIYPDFTIATANNTVISSYPYAYIVMENGKWKVKFHTTYYNTADITTGNNKTHIGVSYNSTTHIATFYVNGVIIYQEAYINTAFTENFMLGLYRNTGTIPFKGLIDDVQFFSTALTQTDFIDIMQTSASMTDKGDIIVNEIDEIGVSSGLVGYYPLKSNANDYSGSGYNGTVSGAVISTNRFGESGSYSFDGVDDYIDLNRDLNDYPDDFTFSYWVYVDKSVGTDAYKRLWFGGTTGSANTYGFNYYLGNTSTSLSLRFAIRTTDNAYHERAVLLTDKTWTHILITKNGTNVKCYKNTEIFGEMTLSISEYNVRTRPVNTILGGILTNNSFGGKIDDVRIYDRALTESEINTLYNYTKGKINANKQIQAKSFSECSITDGLVGWYPLRKNANDYSGYNRHGTVSGAVVSTNRFNESGSYEFEYATTDLIRLYNLLSMPLNFSISMWIYENRQVGDAASVRRFYGGFEDSTAAFGFGIQNNSAAGGLDMNLGFMVRSSPNEANNARSVWAIQGVTNNAWNHVVCIKDDLQISIYLNGIKGSTTTDLLHSEYRRSKMITLGGVDGYSNAFRGKIDDVRIYDRALTEKEIALLYEYGKTKITNDGIVYTKEIKEII